MDLRSYREGQGLTQASIAEKINRDVTSVCKYESGDTMPPLDVLVAIKKLSNGQVDSEDFIKVIKDNDKRKTKGRTRNGTSSSQTV